MAELLQPPDTITVGLRFLRRDAPRLRQLADRMRLQDLRGFDLGAFDQAADAAEQGVPLMVIASSKAEIEQIADAYPMYGVTRPAIDEFNRAV
jgi:hypothetical protein